MMCSRIVEKVHVNVFHREVSVLEPRLMFGLSIKLHTASEGGCESGFCCKYNVTELTLLNSFCYVLFLCINTSVQLSGQQSRFML